MNKLKAALGGIVISSMVLGTGCGSLPNKPSKVSVDGIDITTDTKGNIIASRNGESFRKCIKKDCNFFTKHVEIDSIKPRVLGSSAVVVVEYQVPIAVSKSPIASKSDAVDIPQLDSANPRVLESILQSDNLPLLASSSSAVVQMLFAQASPRYVRRFCGPPDAEGRNGCCNHIFITDQEGSSLLVQDQDDLDCNE